MIDNLQKILYQQQIKKVEHLFRSEIKALMRKTHFIDDISIDNDFIVHIYKNETMDLEHLSQLLSANNKDQVISLIGRRAYSLICSKYHKDTYEEIVHAVTSDNCSAGICLPIEIEKTSLSNGEKQIFIMALYHSLIQLCSHEVPFIIDTPFARIDTEHRINISKHFFSKLTGQVFILSTNEEIDVYGEEPLSRDDYNFVDMPAVIRGQNGKMCLGIVCLDLSSSGEHWGTTFFTPYGILEQGNQMSAVEQKFIRQFSPYSYWYSPEIEGDIHVDFDETPDDVAGILGSCRDLNDTESQILS